MVLSVSGWNIKMFPVNEWKNFVVLRVKKIVVNITLRLKMFVLYRGWNFMRRKTGGGKCGPKNTEWKM